MPPLAALPLLFLPLGVSTALGLWVVVGMSAAVLVCASIPLIVGVTRGHVALGLIAGLATIPVVVFVCFLGVLLTGVLGPLVGAVVCMPMVLGIGMFLKALPRPDRPLLTQAEIEADSRRVRGY